MLAPWPAIVFATHEFIGGSDFILFFPPVVTLSLPRYALEAEVRYRYIDVFELLAAMIDGGDGERCQSCSEALANLRSLDAGGQDKHR